VFWRTRKSSSRSSFNFAIGSEIAIGKWDLSISVCLRFLYPRLVAITVMSSIVWWP